MSNVFATITTLLTIYALIGDDIRLISFEKEDDIFFDALTWTCIGMFSIEIFVCSFGKPDYWMSFFFALDLISTASLFLDITWIAEHFFDPLRDMDAESSSDESGDAGALRAGRAGRAGSKAGRVVRIIRIIRLVRIVKLYKAHLERKRKREQALLAPGERNVFQDEGEEEGAAGTEESRVGKKLSELTTRRVILMVLLMLFAVPQLRNESSFLGAELYMTAASYASDDVVESFRRTLQERENVFY